MGNRDKGRGSKGNGNQGEPGKRNAGGRKGFDFDFEDTEPSDGGRSAGGNQPIEPSMIPPDEREDRE